MSYQKLTLGEWILIVWLWSLGFIVGYALCLGVHRHDAGEDYRRGREQGWNDQVALTSTCTGTTQHKPEPKP